MSTTIGTSPISGIGSSYIPELTDTADIQAALKLLYYGTTSSATTNGIYGALSYLKTSPTFSGNVSVGGTLSVTGNLTAPTISGDTSLSGNLTVGGNLTVNGTNTVVNTTNLSVTDSIIYLSSNQYATDSVDIGFYGAYGTTGGNSSNHKHTGFVRDHTTGAWHLFSNGTEPVGQTVDLTDANLTHDFMTAKGITLTNNNNNIGTSTIIGQTTGSITNTSFALPNTPSNTNDLLISRTSTDTLTNKTLTSPTISTILNSGTLTLPTSTDTLVGRATTDTLTNKTLTDPIIANIKNSGTLAIKNTSGTLYYALASSSTNAVYSAGTDGYGGHTFYGPLLINSDLGLEIAASTGGRAPILLTSGANLVTATAGAIEYDGKLQYFTPSTTSGRGVTPSEYYYSISSDASYSLTLSGSAKSLFPAMTNGLALDTSSIYEFEIFALVDYGTLTPTSSGSPNTMVFTNLFSTPQAYTRMTYEVSYAQLATTSGISGTISYPVNPAPSTPATLSTVAMTTTTAATEVTTSSTLSATYSGTQNYYSAQQLVKFKGLVQTSATAGAKLLPQIKFTYTTISGVSPIAKILSGSYVKVKKISTSSALSNGVW
jgi:hypothetical protein